MSRLQVMLIEIGALLIISFIIRLILGSFGIEEGMASRWLPILAALIIVYSARIKLRKTLLAKKKLNNDNEREN